MHLALALALLSAAPDYSQSLAKISTTRAQLAREFAKARTDAQREKIFDQARAELLRAIDSDIFPAWFGTPWDFNGTTEIPGQGQIACGYFITTVMRDLGFRVERVKLAQQASARIARTLSPDVRWFSDKDPADVIDTVRQTQGDGLYVIGLDYHVVFLRLDGERADLCHAAYYEPSEVRCEPAAVSPAMNSRAHVVGKLFADEQIRAWLQQRAIPTAP